MSLVSPIEYPSVRAAIDVGLDADALPDAVIRLDMYGGAAERDVLARDPLALTYEPSTDAFWNVRQAAIYYCAARLVPAIPNITSEKLGEYAVSMASRDQAALVGELRGRAEACLNAVLGTATSAQIPSLFDRACAARGR